MVSSSVSDQNLFKYLLTLFHFSLVDRYHSGGIQQAVPFQHNILLVSKRNNRILLALLDTLKVSFPHCIRAQR